MQITYQAKALTLAQCVGDEPDPNRMPTIVQTDDLTSYTKAGLFHIGNATVTIDYLEKVDISARQLDSLKAKLQEVRAENQRRENAILDQISKLQALTFEKA